jgi:hypothetical protein
MIYDGVNMLPEMDSPKHKKRAKQAEESPEGEKVEDEKA